MAEQAAEQGYDYLGITDHSEGSTYANGLTTVELKAQQDRIAEVNKDQDITVLHGSEVNIHADGSLDYNDTILNALDLVIASVHSHFDLDEDQQTKRLLHAVKHPAVTCVGHLTGRLLTRRSPIKFDADAVFKAAASHDTAFEINANPRRLDVNAELAKKAVRQGCAIIINTDSHSLRGFNLISYGVGQARRAGLSADDVINTKPMSSWL